MIAKKIASPMTNDDVTAMVIDMKAKAKAMKDMVRDMSDVVDGLKPLDKHLWSAAREVQFALIAAEKAFLDAISDANSYIVDHQ